jgi:hypothetical protein
MALKVIYHGVKAVVGVALQVDERFDAFVDFDSESPRLFVRALLCLGCAQLDLGEGLHGCNQAVDQSSDAVNAVFVRGVRMSVVHAASSTIIAAAGSVCCYFGEHVGP